MAKSNCIVFAILLSRRRRAKGREGYIMRRRSRLWTLLVGHFLYAERRPGGRLRVVSYVPTDKVQRRLPPPWFEGYPRWGDNPD